MDADGGWADEMMVAAIKHAAVAGGCRALAVREPSARRGLVRAADFHSERTSAILALIVAGVVRAPG